LPGPLKRARFFELPLLFFPFLVLLEAGLKVFPYSVVSRPFSTSPSTLIYVQFKLLRESDEPSFFPFVTWATSRICVRWSSYPGRRVQACCSGLGETSVFRGSEGTGLPEPFFTTCVGIDPFFLFWFWQLRSVEKSFFLRFLDSGFFPPSPAYQNGFSGYHVTPYNPQNPFLPY